MELRDLGEFELIERIARRARLDAGASDVSLGIGDDAALLRVRAGEEVVISTDARVENVHFRWATESPQVVGRTALVAALSDLAAMGARTLGFTWALTVPPSLPVRHLDGLAAGLLREARTHACPLVGGNLTRGRETSLALTVVGAVARGRALRRQARAGDRILVTGTLGGSALARARAEASGRPIRRVPTPRLRAGRALTRIASVRGCIDVSDGLEADLAHLLGAALVCDIPSSALPRARGFDAACRRLGLDPVRLLRGGGDEYELLFALAPDGPSLRALARRLALPVSELGRVRRGVTSKRDPARGWRHF